MFLSLLPSAPAKAMDSKAQVMLTAVGYGAVGGAALGVASLAFGGKPRSIAQGASLGLYAGILFGAYVVLGHQNRGRGMIEDYERYGERDEYYPERGTGEGEYLDIDQLRFWESPLNENRSPHFQVELLHLTF